MAVPCGQQQTEKPLPGQAGACGDLGAGEPAARGGDRHGTGGLSGSAARFPGKKAGDAAGAPAAGDRHAILSGKGIWDNTEERKKAEWMYYSAFDHIYKAEIQYLLSELNGDECKDKITFLLEEIPVEGEKFPQGLCHYSIACRGEWGDEGLPLDAYIVWTQHFNRLCDTILSLAINRNNQDLAKMILLKYVDNVEVTRGGDNVVDGVMVDGNHGYIKYTSVDRDAARKKYDEAVRIGAFN